MKKFKTEYFPRKLEFYWIFMGNIQIEIPWNWFIWFHEFFLVWTFSNFLAHCDILELAPFQANHFNTVHFLFFFCQIFTIFDDISKWSTPNTWKSLKYHYIWQKKKLYSTKTIGLKMPVQIYTYIYIYASDFILFFSFQNM